MIKRNFYLLLSLVVMVGSGLGISGCKNSPQPPDEETAAVFKGGTITRQEVQKSVDQLYEIMGRNDESTKHLNNMAAYRSIIEGIALEKTVKQKIRELKLDKRKNFAHALKHINEELNISELHSQTHDRRIKVSDEEIRTRYEKNRASFGQTTLSQATEFIRTQLESEKEEQYFGKYLEDLRKNAVITRYDELLMVPEPDQVDLRMYYDQNRTAYPDKSFAQLKTQILKKVRLKNSADWFQENRNRTLLTIHGKRFSVGEFYDEVQELPPAERIRYQDFDSLKQLLDKMIDRMLVVEDTYDQMLNVETKDEQGHIKEDLLRQVFHMEEIDDKIKITEQEIEAFFNENPEVFRQPPRVQIKYIRISAGQTETEREQAEKRVKEAYEKLNPGIFQKGIPFEEAALEYSEDPETAKNGGALTGWISESSELIEEIAGHGFHENVLGLKENEIGRPFMFYGSYYIVQVTKREAANPATLDEAREAIKSELEARRHQEMTLKLESTLLSQAELIIYNQTIKAMLE